MKTKLSAAQSRIINNMVVRADHMISIGRTDLIAYTVHGHQKTPLKTLCEKGLIECTPRGYVITDEGRAWVEAS